MKLRVKVANKKNRQQDDYFLTKDVEYSTAEDFSFDAPDTHDEPCVNGFNGRYSHSRINLSNDYGIVL